MEITSETKITFTKKTNPKRDGSKAHARFQKYMKARTVGEYFELGGTKGDFKYDQEKEFLIVG